MEHRYSYRFPLEVKVTLDHQALGLLHGVAHDISPDGMYIVETERSLPLNAMFQVSFQFGNTEFNEKVIVVRSSSKGAGVLFHRRLPDDVFSR